MRPSAGQGQRGRTPVLQIDLAVCASYLEERLSCTLCAEPRAWTTKPVPHGVHGCDAGSRTGNHSENNQHRSDLPRFYVCLRVKLFEILHPKIKCTRQACLPHYRVMCGYGLDVLILSFLPSADVAHVCIASVFASVRAMSFVSRIVAYC